MNITAGAYTSCGIVKKVNQDAFSFKVVDTQEGRIAFAIVCDGMGGLEQGELASTEVVRFFDKWFWTDLSVVISRGCFSQQLLYKQWELCIKRIEQKLEQYGRKCNVEIGTTLSMLLVFDGRFYICHVGDSRIYSIHDEVQLLTKDHTLLAREVDLGHVTEEMAKNDRRRNILLQCIGSIHVAVPEFISGEIEKNTTFIMCSDGLVHCISQQEIKDNCMPRTLQTKRDIEHVCKKLVHLVMKRGETDNITVIGVVVST